jgi:hypothetical protein
MNMVLSGCKERFERFFTATRYWQNHDGQLCRALVTHSGWVGEDGYSITVNDKIHDSKLIVEMLVKACGLMIIYPPCPSTVVDDGKEDMLKGFKRLIDYECNTSKYWIGQCDKGTTIWRIYQNQYNSLADLREKLTVPFVLQFLDRIKFDMPEATTRIFE